MRSSFVRLSVLPALVFSFTASGFAAATGTGATALSFTSGPNYGNFSVGDVQSALNATGGTPPYTFTVPPGSLPTGTYIRTDMLPTFFPGGTPAGIIGVATVAGTYNFTLTVTDSTPGTPNKATQNATVLVSPLTVLDPNLSDGFVGVAYGPRTLTSSGSGVTWAVTNGALPGGLTLANGVIQGTPTTVGNFSFTLGATDAVGTVFRGYTISIYGVGFASSTALGNVAIGSTISTPIQITGQGGTPPYSFTGGSFPGLTLSSTGALTGTPNANNGTYRSNITITDHTGTSFTRSFAINYAASLNSNTLPQIGYPNPAGDATLGNARTYSLNVNGGKQPYIWSVQGLPAGWALRTTNFSPNTNLSDTDAEIWGVGLTTGVVTATFTVTDSSSPAITITQPVTFKVVAMDDNFNSPTGTRGSAYTASILAVGGMPPYTFAQIGGSLPAGVSLNTSTGVISGTPTDNGNFTAQIQVTSSAASGSLSLMRFFSVNINSSTTPNISINQTSPLPDALAGVNYTNFFTFSACCANVPIGWTVASGVLPTGMSLNPTNGVIAGIPTVPGQFTFTVQATDSTNAGNFGLKTFTINVAPFSINTPLPFGNTGVAYTTTFTVSGGTGPYTWSLASGSQMPQGLSMSAAGVLSGTPTTAGAFSVNYTVTDSATPTPHHYTGFLFLQIYSAGGGPPLQITTGSNLTFSIGTLEFALNANGGTGAYTWSLASGSLPPGINLGAQPFNTSQTGLVGVATTPGNYPFSLAVQSGVQSMTQAFTVHVTGFTIKDPFNLPGGFANAPYSNTFASLGNAGTVTFTNTGTLPGTMTLSAAGVLSGAAPAGNYAISFSANDGTSTIFRSCNLNISAINFTTPALLPNATQGGSYSQHLVATGGTGSYTFFLSGGGLPNGLSLSTGGLISGSLTNAGPSIYNVYVTATDTNNASYQKRFAIDVIGTPPQLPRIGMYNNSGWDDATIGNQYDTGVFLCCGGTAPFTWTVTGLPQGLSGRTGAANFQAEDLEIWGVPTATGSYNVTVTVTDSSSPALTTTATFPLKVGVLDLAPGIPNGTVGTPESASLYLIGGGPTFPSSLHPVTGGYSAGEIPDGLTINPAGDHIQVTGTPLENGGFQTLLQVSDPNGNGLRRTEFYNINPALFAFLSINNGNDLGTPSLGNYSLSLFGSGGSGSYTWNVAGGSLPPGLVLNASTGVLTGTLTTPGISTFLIKVTDTTNAAVVGYRQFHINVTPLVIANNNPLPFGNLTVAYSNTFTTTGATGAVSFAVQTGNTLPPGITMASNGTLGGTPTSTGQYFFNVIATDSASHTATRGFTLNVFPSGTFPPLTFNTGANMGTWHMGTDFVALDAAGGNGTYTWTLVSGTLPTGLALRTDKPSFFSSSQQAGLIGVATTPGTYNFTLNVASGGQTASRAFTIRITAVDLRDLGLPDSFVGTPFTYTFTSISGGGFTFSPNSSLPLPAWLTLSSSGTVSGTPPSSGFFGINFLISDGVDTVNENYTLNVYAVNITTPGALPNATQQGTYTTSLAASGGAGGYTFTANCCLPSGLTLSPGGTISGTVTSGASVFSFPVTATDSNNVSYTKTMSIDVVGSPVGFPEISNLPIVHDPVIGDRYGYQIAVCCGGTAPFTWSATGLPSGIFLRTGSGITSTYIAPGWAEIYGIAQAAGDYPVRFTVHDANGLSATAALTLHVSQLDVTGASGTIFGLPNGTINVPYTQTMRVIGGSGPYSFTQYGGNLPAGLALTSNTLTVSGTPIENVNDFADFQFADGAGHTLKRGMSVNIGGGSTIQVNGNGFNGYILGPTPVNVPFSTTFSACCVPSFTWTIVSGALPAGMALSPSGTLSGTPTAAGTYTFLVSGADATNPSNAGLRQFTLIVTPLTMTTNSPLPFANVGTPYTASLTATGGTGALTWSLQFNSSLPPGLSLSASGAISGTPTTTGQYFFNIGAVDTAGSQAIRGFSLNIYANGAPPPLNLGFGPNIGTFPVGVIQIAFPVATGGVPPYHYSLAPGATVVVGMRVQDGAPLPAGFASTTTGGYIGVVTAAGSYSTTIRVTDAANATLDRPVTFVVSPLALLSQSSLPKATIGSPYSFTFTPSGGSGSYTWGSSGLPATFSLSQAGVLTGTPTAATSFGFNVQLTDPAVPGVTVSFFESIAVNPFDITDGGVLPAATFGTPYSHAFSAPNCGAGCAWTILNSVQPFGLTLNASTGVLSGNPNTAVGNVTTFTLQAVGANGTVQKLFSLPAAPTEIEALSISTAITNTGVVGSLFATQLSAIGGTPPYTFTLQSGTLPPGITLQGPGETIGNLNPGFQELAGRATQIGTYNFNLKVADSSAVPLTASKAFTWSISTMTLDYTTLPVTFNGVPAQPANPIIYNTPYSQQLLVIGGSGHYTSWTDTLSPVYPGLTLNGTTGLVSGTPTNTGFTSGLLTVTDSNGATLTQSLSITANSTSTATLGLNGGPAVGATIIAGANTFNLSPTETPASPGALYSITPVGSLPPGVTLISGNALTTGFGTGTYDLEISPIAAGTLTFTLKATDVTPNAPTNGLTGARTYSVNAVDFGSSTTTALPDGSVGVAYSQPVVVFGGVSGAWAVATGSTLPPGLSVSAAGVISGTPGAAGLYAFNLAFTDASGTQSFFYTIRVSTLAITSPTTLPIGIVGTAYNAQLTPAGGGATGLTWTAANGLPSGLSISPAGIISGTPNTAGRTVVTFQLTNGASPVTETVQMFVRQPIPTLLDFSLLATTLTDAVLNQNYTIQLVPGGGLPPYAWTVTAGSTLPPGLSLISGAGLPTNFAPGTTILGGKPTAAGQYTFSLTATDSASGTITRSFTLNVTPLNIVNGNPPSILVGTPYSFQFTTTGGTGPYTYSIAPANLSFSPMANGITLSASGNLAGTATTEALSLPRITVTDSAGHSLTRAFTIFAVNSGGFYININDTIGISAGLGFQSAPLTVSSSTTAGTGTYNWSVFSGSLPPGISLVNANGNTVLRGAPPTPGTYAFTLRATDTANAASTIDHTMTIVVSPMQLVVPHATSTRIAPPYAQVGTPYSLTLKAAGGTPPYTFSESAFNPLPPGITLSSVGVLAGTPTQPGVFVIAPFITDATGNAVRLIPTNTGFALIVTAAGQTAPMQTSTNVNISGPSLGVPYILPLDRLFTNGKAPFTWSDPNHTLPRGLQIFAGVNGTANYLAGIPTTAGTYNVALVVNDSSGQSLPVGGPLDVSPITLTPDSIPSGIVGTPYSVSLFPAGGTAPYTIQAQANLDMPPGLTLSPSGVLSGTPTHAGNFVIQVNVTDSLPGTPNQNEKVYEITIDDASGEAPAVTFATRPVNVYYTTGSPAPTVGLGVTSTSGAVAYTGSFTGAGNQSVATFNGTTAGTVNLSFPGATTAAAGTYFGLAALASSGAVNQTDVVPVLLTVATPPPCTYSLNPTSATITAAGGSGSFGVSAGPTCAWTAIPSDPSVTISGGTGSGLGNGTVTYSVAANSSQNQRNSTVAVANQTYSISQFGLSCSFGIVPASISATAGGGTALIQINASDSSCPWTATGLSVTPASGTGSQQVQITIAANATNATLTPTATVAGQTLTVSETGQNCVAALDSGGASYPPGVVGGITGQVNITMPAGCPYTTVPGPSWIHVTAGGSGTATGGPLPVTYTVDASSTTVTRSGSLTIGGSLFQITQSGLACSVSLDTSTLGSPFAVAGGTGTINITTNGSNCPWTAVSNNSFATVSPSGGSGNASVSVTASSNSASTSTRTGSVTISGQPVSFSQGGTVCSFNLRSSSGAVPSSGGSGSVGVVAASACSWTSLSNVPWLSITSSGNAGSSDVLFTAQPNTNAAPRTGTLTIAGQTFTVTEAGAPCSFTLASLTSPLIAAAGASNETIGFTAATNGCAITPVSYANWITISSTLTGTAGTLTYSVAANPAGTTRTGNVQVGDKLFTVTQSGAACAFSLNIYGAAFGQAGGDASFLGSPNAQGCIPVVGGTQPTITVLGPLVGPANNVFTQPYTVSVFTSPVNAVRRATITFGGQIFTVKQTSW